MAVTNQLYGLAREKFLKGEIDWHTDDIKCCLVDAADYTVDIDVDEFVHPALEGVGKVVATSGNLANKTHVLGVADADDITFSAVTGDQCEALVIYKDTGDPDTSPLIAYISSATGLPVTPSGGDITVVWDSGANKIFKL